MRALTELPYQWIIAFCDEWTFSLIDDAKSFMYGVVISPRLTKSTADFQGECKAPIENCSSELLQKCWPHVVECKKRLRFRIKRPTLSPDLEASLREAVAKFEPLGEVWAFWDNETDKWIVTSVRLGDAEDFKQGSNFVADVLALENEGREPWEIWLDWLRQEDEPASEVSQRTRTDGTLIAFEEVKFHDAAKASQNNIQQLLSRVMRLKQQQRVMRMSSMPRPTKAPNLN